MQARFKVRAGLLFRADYQILQVLYVLPLACAISKITREKK